jgi:restriction system protein
MLALLTPKFLSAPRDAHTKVHFQAKRWKNPVGANAIRDFIGGIQTSRGEYGIFVTTSEFTRDAIETAKKSGKVKLVDGHEMARLMIEYSLGVAKTRVHVAKIDRDYFEGL